VDWLQGVVLVALFKEPEAAHLDALKQLLVQFEWAQSDAHTVALQHRYLPQSTTEWLVGDAIDELTITEGGLRYLIDLGKNRTAGCFSTCATAATGCANRPRGCGYSTCSPTPAGFRGGH